MLLENGITLEMESPTRLALHAQQSKILGKANLVAMYRPVQVVMQWETD